MDLAEKKYVQLRTILSRFKRIAVAYSGGIDSTFLLYSALHVLGRDNVLAYTCVSEVNSEHALKNMRDVFQHHFAKEIALQEVRLYPLTWKDFTVNDDKRCYVCKKHMYSTLLDEIAKKNCSFLLDGTNVDDLKQSRPGLRAIQELKIQTPLVEAGLTKQEIRLLARANNLINYNLSSNSCLATRVTQGVEIKDTYLDIVETAEEYLHTLGFKGCRVKVDGNVALVELDRNDFVAFVEDDVRIAVLRRFSNLGLQKVSLSLTGR